MIEAYRGWVELAGDVDQTVHAIVTGPTLA